MRKLIRIAVLVLGAFAFSAALAEVAVRALLPQNLVLIRGDVWIPHDRYAWTTAPNLDVKLSAGESAIRFLTDAEGNRVGPAGASDADLRILAIGDSFLQAVEVEYEETFGALLAERLTREVGQSVAVVNAGVSGWSPNQYRLLIDDALGAGEYELAVVFLYLGNDVIGKRVREFAPRAPTVRHDLRIPRDLSRREIVDAVLYPINDFLEERSHLFTLAKDRALLLRMKFGLTSIRMPIVLDRAVVRARNWDLTASILEEMAQVATLHGTGFAVVLLPSIHEVDREYVDRYVRFLGVDASRFDLDQASREMRRSIERRGLAVIDATPALRDAYELDGSGLYDRVTIHLSPSGHRAVAEAGTEPLAALLDRR